MPETKLIIEVSLEDSNSVCDRKKSYSDQLHILRNYSVNCQQELSVVVEEAILNMGTDHVDRTIFQYAQWEMSQKSISSDKIYACDSICSIHFMTLFQLSNTTANFIRSTSSYRK